MICLWIAQIITFEHRFWNQNCGEEVGKAWIAKPEVWKMMLLTFLTEIGALLLSIICKISRWFTFSNIPQNRRIQRGRVERITQTKIPVIFFPSYSVFYELVWISRSPGRGSRSVFSPNKLYRRAHSSRGPRECLWMRSSGSKRGNGKPKRHGGFED